MHWQRRNFRNGKVKTITIWLRQLNRKISLKWTGLNLVVLGRRMVFLMMRILEVNPSLLLLKVNLLKGTMDK